MNHKIGIWIDHKKAVIVSASADGVTAETLESAVGPHGRYSVAQGNLSRRLGITRTQLYSRMRKYGLEIA